MHSKNTTTTTTTTEQSEHEINLSESKIDSSKEDDILNQTSTSPDNAVEEKEPPEKKEIQILDSFEGMSLHTTVLRGIYSHGFEKPSIIQAKAIVPFTTGTDLVAQSQSGTGKTGTFVIGTVQRVLTEKKSKFSSKSKHPKSHGPLAIIISPTRELADQSYKVCGGIASYTGLVIEKFVGGTSVRDNRKALDTGDVDVAVVTPGRLLHLLGDGSFNPDDLCCFILDEADELLSRGFQEQLYDIFRFLPSATQVCIFSATLPEEVLDITGKFMKKDKIQILVKRSEVTLRGIVQFYIKMESRYKMETLFDLYNAISVAQSIIFVNTKRMVDELAYELNERDFTVGKIHSDMTTDERTKILNAFRNGESRVLLATNIIARGIDAQGVSLVINYDFPTQKEDYIHRVGRGGRFGKKGLAINFVTDRDTSMFREIQEHYETQIEELPMNFEDDIIIR